MAADTLLTAVRAHLKLVWWENTGVMALFDTSADPGELHSVLEHPDYREQASVLQADLVKFLRERGKEM